MTSPSRKGPMEPRADEVLDRYRCACGWTYLVVQGIEPKFMHACSRGPVSAVFVREVVVR